MNYFSDPNPLSKAPSRTIFHPLAGVIHRFRRNPFTLPLVFSFLLIVNACGPNEQGPEDSAAASGGVGAAPEGSGGLPSSGGSATTGGAGPLSGGTGAGGSPSGGGPSLPGGGDTGAGGTSAGGTGAGAGGMGVGGTIEGGLFPSTTSAELLAAHPLGWNLGNSLDAPEGETAWGNPAVTASLINAVAAAGFTLVRVPVTWSLHTGAGPEYLIDAAFLDRVAQVVEMVHAAGMLALINLHHDGADAYGGEVEWLSLNDEAGLVTDANNQAVQARFSALWAQIATRFEPYGEGLLFESMNEIHDGYDAPAVEYYAIINQLNQLFVETVRATGTNNAQRHLVVPGYNTNVDYTLQGFTAPVDSIAGRLILSVHYYDPWSFAGEASTNTWGTGQMGTDTWGQEDHVVTQFNALKATYVDMGLPVIIGEYGAVNQEGYEDYRRYYMEYVTQAAIERGIVPIYWDNGSQESGAEAFGLFNRGTNETLYPAIVEAMMRAKTESQSDIEPPTP